MSNTVYAVRVVYRHSSDLHAMRLNTPVLLTRVRYSAADEAWFATDDITGEFGMGETRREAIADYVENLHAMAHWFRTNDLPIGRMMQVRYRTFHRLFLNF